MSEEQSVEVIVITCAHDRLSMQIDYNCRIYQCEDCKKRIEIPLLTMVKWQDAGQDAQENLAGIIKLSFGEQWAELARQGRV